MSDGSADEDGISFRMAADSSVFPLFALYRSIQCKADLIFSNELLKSQLADFILSNSSLIEYVTYGSLTRTTIALY